MISMSGSLNSKFDKIKKCPKKHFLQYIISKTPVALTWFSEKGNILLKKRFGVHAKLTTSFDIGKAG